MVEPVVGLIGCGHVGRFHSRNIRGSLRSGLVEGRYVALCDRLPGRAEEFASFVEADVVTADPREVLDRPGLNAVYICTETTEHPALVAEAAARGHAIFCEKPLAKSLSEVREMVRAVEAAGVINQVGLILRHSPVFTVVKELASQDGLGPLLTAHLRDDQFFPIRGQYGSDWRGDVAKAGGGTLIEHSIHDVDVFRWLFGEIEAVRCHTRETTGHAGVEDVALATFQHAGGHQTTLSSVWHDIDARPSTRSLEVFFEGGWIATESDFIGPIRWQPRRGPEVELSADEVFERYVAIVGLNEEEARLARLGMYEDLSFLRCVRDGRRAFPDFRTALAAHEVVDACYRSAREGREVRVRAG